METRTLCAKHVDGYEGLYSVDKNGCVYSHPKKTRKGTRKLNPIKYSNGYLVVDLVKNGKRKKHLVHRLVCIAFLENKKNKPQVNHKNGIKSDNRLCNLEWNTRSENQKHAIKTGLRHGPSGEKNGQCKLSEKEVMSIFRSDKEYKTIANTFKISLSTVYDIKSQRSWGHLTKYE